MAKVTFEQAAVVTMLEELGFKMAAKWDTAKLTQRLKGIKASIDEDNQPDSDESIKLLEEVVAAIDGGDEIVITPPAKAGKGKPEPKGKAAPAKTPEKGKGKTEPKEKKEPKAEVEKDRFGNKKDSALATFNACISNKPKTMQELVAEAGMEPKDTRYNHINKLIEDGLVERTEDKKYKLTTPKK